MNTYSFARRVSALVLVIGMPVVGTPFPAHAAGEEPASLTFNGRPLSHLLDSGSVGDLWPVAAPERQPGGQITGVLLDEDQRPLANRRVELDRPSRMWEGRLAMTTDPDGTFSYSGLEPGRYEVQYRVEGRVVATSGHIFLTTDAMRTTAIRMSEAGANERDRNRRSMAKKAAVAGVAVVGAVFLVIYAVLTQPNY